MERLLTHYVPEVRGLLSEDDEEAKHKGYSPYIPKEMQMSNGNSLSISEEAKVQMPMKTVASLIVLVAIGTWAYFGIIETQNKSLTRLELMEKDLVENTAFRIGWPRGTLGSLPR